MATPVSKAGADVKVRIVNDTFGSTVEIDGREVPSVRCVTVRHEAGSLPLVTVEVIGGELELNGEADVVVQERDT